MKLKKYFSVLFIAMVALFLGTTSFAQEGLYSPLASDSDDLLSDIVIMEVVDVNDGNCQQMEQMLEEKMQQSNTELDALRVIHAKNQEEFDKLNGRICDLMRERDNFKFKYEFAEAELEKWGNDVLCASCGCKGLHKFFLKKYCPVCCSKRFCQGVVAGSLAVAIVLVGVYVYVYYVKL